MEKGCFTIRQAKIGDETFLWDMLYESIHVEEGSEKPGRDIINQPSISKYVEGWGREGDIGFIAEDSSGKPIGSITCRFFSEENKGYGYVDANTPELGMAILAEYRGKGLGTELIKCLLEEVKGRGIMGISLSVDPDNPAARLYRRFGFIEVGVEGTSIVMKKDF
jgi:ribosomal protein S18 acetylase RimI-like enzyme